MNIFELADMATNFTLSDGSTVEPGEFLRVLHQYFRGHWQRLEDYDIARPGELEKLIERYESEVEAERIYAEYEREREVMLAKRKTDQLEFLRNELGQVREFAGETETTITDSEYGDSLSYGLTSSQEYLDKLGPGISVHITIEVVTFDESKVTG